MTKNEFIKKWLPEYAEIQLQEIKSDLSELLSTLLKESKSMTVVVSTNVAMGIEKYHKEFDVELIKIKGLSEESAEVTVIGTLLNLKLLNDKAADYKPTVTRTDFG